MMSTKHYRDAYELVAGVVDDPDMPELNSDEDVAGVPLTRYVWTVGGDPDAV